jgi:hypothetical protein
MVNLVPLVMLTCHSCDAFEQTFGIAWTTSPGLAPYTCTIVPLDASYNPWQVLLTDNSDGS